MISVPGGMGAVFLDLGNPVWAVALRRVHHDLFHHPAGFRRANLGAGVRIGRRAIALEGR